jgi:hypothetical protein
MEQSDECIKILDKWIIENKNIIYDIHITNNEESSNGLQEYQIALKKYGNEIINAINRQLIDDLKEKYKWPDNLLECLNDSNISTEIKDTIQQCFIHFPYVKCKIHMEELKKQLAGINSAE